MLTRLEPFAALWDATGRSSLVHIAIATARGLPGAVRTVGLLYNLLGDILEKKI